MGNSEKQRKRLNRNFHARFKNRKEKQANSVDHSTVDCGASAINLIERYEKHDPAIQRPKMHREVKGPIPDHKMKEPPQNPNLDQEGKKKKKRGNQQMGAHKAQYSN